MEANVAHDVFVSVRDDAPPLSITQGGIDDVSSAVVIVDGDVSIRVSLERLVRTASWEAESFASPAEFLFHSLQIGSR